MGEKFAANPVTGTASLGVPIFTSPGRSGLGPQLSLSYDSGAGNGPFGFGWSLSLPSITRKTDKGLPTYRDADESDVFILSGSEDLVPVPVEVGQSVRTVGGVSYQIRRYRPRIEGPFARLERWTNEADPADVFWRSISRDNVTTLYGKTPESRVFDPADPARIFSWLICESHDDKGNAILYEYVVEDSEGVDASRAHERNRNDESRAANRYLKRIKYGNRTPRKPEEDLALRTDWLFELVLDYGEHDADEPTPDDDGSWLCRHDPFSSYSAGFEVRTYRLCQRALMFHHFPDEEEVGENCLVRSTDLVYRDIRGNAEDLRKGHPIASFLAAVTETGYRRLPGGYLKKSPPPLEFEYSQASIHDEVREIDPESLENLPYGLDGTRYQWIDLDGEGMPGILTDQAGAWFYKRNISPVSFERWDGEETEVARFDPMELVGRMPSLAGGNAGRQQFLDLAGDGSLDLVQLGGPLPGFYERTDAGWDEFTAFVSLPGLDWDDPNLRFVDLTGDGHADILLTEDHALAWHPSLAEAGFGREERVSQSWDEERGPRLVFADGAQSIHLADLSGDGLTDLVRIRNGEVSYWPNLGYCRFGSKVTMDDSPWFDAPEQFEGRRIRLADIDGSGVTDIIYLGRDGVSLYFNQSGNGWGERHALDAFPRVDDVSAVTALDLLGNGTACLLWSSPLPGDAGRQMRYVDLMGGEKPHLLVKAVNNLGAETRVRYASSTRFYLQDKRGGRPWITRLPFPVHVVDRVETNDRISRNRFVTRYRYHHGHFDAKEREFRGFGMVEQYDTEELGALNESGALQEAANVDFASHVPPVLTKTWFHTGVFAGRDRISQFFAGLLDGEYEGEYYREPGLDDAQANALLLPDTVLPAGLSPEEEREACRALKGSMMRQEVYALDGTLKAQHPYTVAEQNFAIQRLQPKGDNRHAVFFTHAREAITYHYERDPADPRIQHALTLEVDAFGNVLKEVAVGYGRRAPDPQLSAEDQKRQSSTLLTYTENLLTNAVDASDDHRTPLPAETRTYELTGYAPTGPAGRFQVSDFAVPDPSDLDRLIHVFDSEITYEQEPTGGRQRRLIEQVRTLYRKDDLTGLLGLGILEPRAIPGEGYGLAFTPGLLGRVFQRDGEDLLEDPAGLLGGSGADHGGYVDLEGDGCWWIPSGRAFLSPGGQDTAAEELAYARHHFYLPRRQRDPFHTEAVSTESLVIHDAYDLLTLETRDALGNRITAGERLADGTIDPTRTGNDYRVLQPRLVMDPNRNRASVAFDALGMVVGTAVMGKPEEVLGDSLVGFATDPTEAEVLDHLANPLDEPHALLGRATTRMVYDLDAYRRTRDLPDPQPAAVYTLSRETHDSDLASGQQTKIQHSFSYSDGFGREIQQKTRAEPGTVPERDASGKIVVGADGRPEMTAGERSPRWVGSGWTVFDNKANPVRQYEPFFTNTHRFEFDVDIGISPILFYDPVGRVVATLNPNHTWAKVVFDTWRQEAWDPNDTVLVADPASDDEVGDFFRRLPDNDYLPTWHAARQSGALGAEEQDAARKATVHAGTPIVSHADPLGRTYLTVTSNAFEYSDASQSDLAAEELHRARVHFDIESNQREVIDALGRIVMRHEYDMLGNRIYQISMEAGARWMLDDVVGRPIRAWDSRGHESRTAYDPLRRPLRSFIIGADPEVPNRELLTERLVYGEQLADGEAVNLRGRLYLHLDQAGVVSNDAKDFKGNPLSVSRRLARDYKNAVDWRPLDEDHESLPPDAMADLDSTRLEAALAPILEAETYTSRTTYDALNRAVTVRTPDESVIRPGYNEASLLERIEANLRGAQQNGQPHWTPFVADIDYDARGQRERIEYGNGASTAYEYDPHTFRLIRLSTTRATDNATLQALRYTYDPVGNISNIRDDAQQTVFFRNKRVEPNTDYTYDSVSRLIEATGREHLGQVGGAPLPHSHDDAPRVGVPHPGDGDAMGRYLERYVYDAVGNFLEMQHRGSDPANPGWTRAYAYEEASLTEPARPSNRLSRTTVGSPGTEPYSYDAHGNLTRMNQLPLMRWDHRDQLRATSEQVVDTGDSPETTYYVYDAAGQRVRKVTERAATNGQTPGRKAERIYLGGLELYREYENDGEAVALERETVHVMDEDQRIALIETRTRGSDPSPQQLFRFQLGNHLGSVSLELDDQCRIISYEEYTPYGSTSYQAVRGQTEVPKRYRYTGQERDEESGLYYHGARYYAPWLGRWTSADPADLMDGVNVYSYTRNNPVRFSDPTGNLTSGQWAGIAAAIVVGTVVTVATAGLLGPVVGATAATVIGGIAGGAAGGAMGEIVEAKVDGRPVTAGNVLGAAAVGAVAGGALAGAGAGASAALRTAAGKTLAGKVASSAAGRVVSNVASRVARSSVGRGASRTVAAIQEPAERLGQRISERTGVGPGARMAQAARARAAANTRSNENIKGVTRETTSADQGETFSHAVGWRPGGNRGIFTDNVVGAQIEAQGALRLSPVGEAGQWGEGAYAFRGSLDPNRPGTAFQFRVPPQTAVETVNIPGSESIIRLVPPPGQGVLPIRITGTNFPAAVLEEGRQYGLQNRLFAPQVRFGYTGVSPDTTGLSGGLGSTFFAPIAPPSEDSTATPAVGVRF